MIYIHHIIILSNLGIPKTVDLRAINTEFGDFLGPQLMSFRSSKQMIYTRKIGGAEVRWDSSSWKTKRVEICNHSYFVLFLSPKHRNGKRW